MAAAVKVAKNMMCKCAQNKEDPYLGLLNLRNTPIEIHKHSPSQLLFGRRTRTLIATDENRLRPGSDNSSVAQQQENPTYEVMWKLFWKLFPVCTWRGPSAIPANLGSARSINAARKTSPPGGDSMTPALWPNWQLLSGDAVVVTEKQSVVQL